MAPGVWAVALGSGCGAPCTSLHHARALCAHFCLMLGRPVIGSTPVNVSPLCGGALRTSLPHAEAHSVNVVAPRQGAPQSPLPRTGALCECPSSMGHSMNISAPCWGDPHNEPKT